jgi:hypothetical protein
MIKPRADLGFGAALDDLGGFDLKPKAIVRLDKADSAQAAQAAGFQSREPQAAKPVSTPQRRRRTGRNVQFNIKTTAETIATFCAIADANGWGLGETLEHAVALLQHKNKTD